MIPTYLSRTGATAAFSVCRTRDAVRAGAKAEAAVAFEMRAARLVESFVVGGVAAKTFMQAVKGTRIVRQSPTDFAAIAIAIGLASPSAGVAQADIGLTGIATGTGATGGG